MMKHEQIALDFPPRDRISKMNASEIISHFEWLKFEDDHGHQLTMCDDFLELVDLATEAKRQAKPASCIDISSTIYKSDSVQ